MNINEAHSETLVDLCNALLDGTADDMSPAELAVWALDRMVETLRS